MARRRLGLPPVLFALASLAVLGSTVLGSASAAPVGMAYLKIGAGAEAVAMGNAVVSNVEGPSATYWNPAALAFQPGLQATVAHNESFQSIRQEFAGITRSFGRLGLGVSLHGTWSDQLDSYDNAGIYQGKFGYYGISTGLAGGYQMSDSWSLGVGASYVREQLDTYSADGISLDAGVLGRDVFAGLDFGLALLHLGPNLRYVDQQLSLPMTVQGGATYRLRLPSIGATALLAAEVRKVREEDPNLQLGVEYRLREVARLRLGYRSGLDSEDVSFGIGLHQGSVQADYAYVPFGDDLGTQHRIGITYRRQ
ncbi:MAG: PorV/PorQ family protein [Candidatus Eisenbacteria bacterium]